MQEDYIFNLNEWYNLSAAHIRENDTSILKIYLNGVLLFSEEINYGSPNGDNNFIIISLLLLLKVSLEYISLMHSIILLIAVLNFKSSRSLKCLECLKQNFVKNEKRKYAKAKKTISNPCSTKKTKVDVL